MAPTSHSIPSFNPKPVRAEHLKIPQGLSLILERPIYSEICKKKTLLYLIVSSKLLQLLSLLPKDPIMDLEIISKNLIYLLVGENHNRDALKLFFLLLIMRSFFTIFVLPEA